MSEGNFPDNKEQILYLKDDKKNSFRGYRIDYLAQNLTEMEEGFLLCKECSGIMREPSICDGEVSCLICSRNPDKLNTVNAVQSSISRLAIKCPLLRDCEWKGKLSEAEGHLGNCLHFLVQCGECKQVFPSGVRWKHETELCPLRVLECQYCHKRERLKDLKGHFENCPNHPISCLNNCGAKFLRCQLPQHRSECELEEITCPYKEYGCDAKSMLRRDLLAHKRENIVEHTDMSLVQIRQQKNEIRLYKDILTELSRKEEVMQGFACEFYKGDSFYEEEMYYSGGYGPDFYVGYYKMSVWYMFDIHFQQRDLLKVASSLYILFRINRIRGEFDNKAGKGTITRYRLTIVNQEDSNKSLYEEGAMNYQPKLDVDETERIKCSLPWETFQSCLIPAAHPRDEAIFVKLEFDIDEASKQIQRFSMV